MGQPNIILLSLDSLRADHLPMYGYERDTSPGLRRLTDLDETTVYKRAFANAPWTLPSHTSIFTGMSPLEHGIFDERREVPQETTIPSKISDFGYTSAAFLNNGWLKEGGVHRGFDEVVEVYEKRLHQRTIPKIWNKVNNVLGRIDNGAEQNLIEFREWLNEESDRPFLAFLHFMEPHWIYKPPRPFNRKYSRGSVLKNWRKQRILFNDRWKFFDGEVPLSARDIDGMIDLYDGEISYLDSKLQTLFSDLKSKDVFDESLIVIFGDHGDHFGERGLIGHNFSLHDEVLHVPLIIKWPKSASPRFDEFDGLITLSDIFTTIIEYAHGEEEEELVTLPLLDQEKKRKEVFAHYSATQSIREEFSENGSDGLLDTLDTDIISIRTENFRLISTPSDQRLYDITSPPKEQSDISNQHPDLTSKLLDDLNSWKDTSVEIEFSTRNNIDEDMKTHLQDLGYM